MGQALSSETMSISGGDGYRYWVGLTMKPSEVGCKKTVYKGVLIGHGPRQWEKIVAKAFTEIPGTKESWKYELNKADVTKTMAAKFGQDHPSLSAIRIVIPGIVQMDRVSNVNKWIADKDDGRGLTKDEWISVEELIPGKMVHFCPWSTKHNEAHVKSLQMEAFSHFTYKYTNGELVACDFQGVYDDKSLQYILTDSSIHSTFKMYGLFDQGDYGISEFFKLHSCNEICSNWPKPTPLTPPPSFEMASILQRNLTPASAFENIIFPAYTNESIAQGCERNEVNTSERRRHCSEQHRQQLRASGSSWIGHSVDLHRYQRLSNVMAEEETVVRENLLSDNKYLPPRYENLSPPECQPPSYDSLVNRGKNRGVTSLFRSKVNHGSQNQLKTQMDNTLITTHLMYRQRSATDPNFHHDNAGGQHCCGSSYIPTNQQEKHISPNEAKSGLVFYVDEALHPLVVPSAPPEEVVPSAPPEDCDDNNET